jgi:hypothetical protein
MSGIFDALPGIDAPAGSISRGLENMWAGNSSSGKPAPNDEHATAIQVNFVLHLGLKTDAEDAAKQFDIAVKFSRRHPSRVVVLCPAIDEGDGPGIRAKVYGECTLGKSADDTRCCEFVMLTYPPSARRYLESQVSVCLSPDLPLYYWAHRFADTSRLADYRYLLTTARRVILDSAAAPADAMSYPWPKPENVRDLAFARLLPVRQSVAQFLSRFSPEQLASGLRSVSLVHGAEVAAEANVLLPWVADRLHACGAPATLPASAKQAGAAPGAFALTFDYSGGKSFMWNADLGTGHSVFEADFGSGKTTLPAAVSLLAPEAALGEAMFF